MRKTLIGLSLAAVMTVAGQTAPATAAPPHPDDYTFTVGTKGEYRTPTDTPASSYIDSDGTFYFQQAAALYGPNDPRHWDFFTGENFDDAKRSSELSDYVNPDNPEDRNNDTTWRCNNSPTGVEATAAPPSYSQKNYCDLVGNWVDPDTGDWVGLVHNEFTGRPFGDRLHYDGIDRAISKDGGRTWTITDHIITSPYSTKRGDEAAFPNQTYNYGDGDPRLFVDAASGYFYVYYGSRVIPKAGAGGGNGGLAHVARAPISGKMEPGTWEKWYDGTWSQPGVGGKESNLVPVNEDPRGYTAVEDDYDPANTGNVDEQIAAGELPRKSSLFIMNISYNAHLGLYIGEPEWHVSGQASPQHYYATKDLSTQKWSLIGDTGDYTTESWYRWLVDAGNKTDSTIVGKNFRAYCSFFCSNGAHGEYVNISIDTTKPAAPVDLTKTYRITSADGTALGQDSAQKKSAKWFFAPNNDGSYGVIDAATGNAVGVDATSKAGRAWGARPTTTPVTGKGLSLGQQWWIVSNKSAAGTAEGTVRLINRYSGLALSLPGTGTVAAETAPVRHWTAPEDSSLGDNRTGEQQTLRLKAVGKAPRGVFVTSPDDQTWTVGQAVKTQVTASSPSGGKLRHSATGLPAGVTIDAGTGLITGTPTSASEGTATITVSDGKAKSTATFDWIVEEDLSGTHTLSLPDGRVLGLDRGTGLGTPLTAGAATGEPAQSWTFARQGDGSYTLTNEASGTCADVDGASGEPGATVLLWSCTGAANQKWTVTALDDGTYRVTSKGSGLVLTADAGGDGLITQEEATSAATQRWALS